MSAGIPAWAWVLVVLVALLLLLIVVSLRRCIRGQHTALYVPPVPVPPVDTKALDAAHVKWVRAQDGRIIEYAVRGSTRPDARVLVSGYAALPVGLALPDAWARALDTLNVREISVSVPGLGNSTLQPGRAIADWPRTDLAPVLDAEGVRGAFAVFGGSFGCMQAFAAAQHFGARVCALGLRAPYLPRTLSKELGLPDGQPSFPATSSVRTGSLSAVAMAYGLSFVPVGVPGPRMRRAMDSGLMGGNAKRAARMQTDHPALHAFVMGEMEKSMFRGHYTFQAALMYNLAADVALDAPGLDVRAIDLPRERVVVWYGEDDDDCPPSHGKWTYEHFGSRGRAMTGYGHTGACVIDHASFLEELFENVPADASKDTAGGATDARKTGANMDDDENGGGDKCRRKKKKKKKKKKMERRR